MASLTSMARESTDLDQHQIAHLQRLLAAWGLLADLCFADLLLYVPDRQTGRYLIVGQIRPTTSQTVYRADWVGASVDRADQPLIHRAYTVGTITEGEVTVEVLGERLRVLAIPVRHNGEVIAVLTRELGLSDNRQAGELEQHYIRIFGRFAKMIADGAFPFGAEDDVDAETTRVGDGVVLLDGSQRVTFASPNAVSALHRVGVHANTEGHQLGELGLEDGSVRNAYRQRLPQSEEVERGHEVTVVVRCVPLIEGDTVAEAMVLLRDISEVRRRDLLLLSKDATIREIHHRVKNNLQTIASLLRIQGRRLESDEAKGAVEESVRRIRSIALVHEMLSAAGSGDQAPFADIVRSLTRMVSDSMLTSEYPVGVTVTGDVGELESPFTTRLAVVLSELMQNAVEHGFARDRRQEIQHAPAVRVELERVGADLVVRVVDNGVGLPPDFDVQTTPSLGLSIVRTLVATELRGTLELQRVGNHTVAELVVPLTQGLEVQQQ
jgi:two-component sensor histidine kinase